MDSAIFAPGLLDGRVAIVSGAGSGIGRETALEFARLGAHVAICGRRREPVEETAALAPDSFSTYECDIRDAEQVDALVDDIVARHGGVDILVNNAGGQFLSPAEDITPKGFETVTRLNVQGSWLMTHAVATKSMIPSGKGGRVINITISPHSGLPGMVHSSAARAGVEAMARVLSVEWARFGIKVNSVAVGQVATDTLLTKYPPQVVENLSQSVPAGRLGRSEEIAWAVAYLASPAGDFISGSTLTVDGARDNWIGPWPPAQIADSEGRPPAESRRGE